MPGLYRKHSMPLSLTDMEQLGLAALDEFKSEIIRAPDVIKGVHRLEAKLEHLYAVAALMAQRERTLEGVATIWAVMVPICDRMAQALTNHRARLASPESYERILDIRNACEDNRALHA